MPNFIIFNQSPQSNTYCFQNLPKNIDVLEYYIPSTIKIIGNGCLENLNIKTLYSNQVTTIEANACKNTQIETLFINKNITFIGNNAFLDTDLKKIIFEPGSKITTFGQDCFGGSSNSVDVFFSTIDYSNVSVFSSLLHTKAVFSPGTDVSYHEIDNFTFVKTRHTDNWIQIDASQTELTREDVSNSIAPLSITDITEIMFNLNLQTISNECFANCPNLKILNFNDEIDLHTIGSNAFKECTSLKTLIFPKSIENISDSAFKGCQNLSFIGFPEGTDEGALQFGSESFYDICQNNVHVNFVCISNPNLNNLKTKFNTACNTSPSNITYSRFIVNQPDF